MPQLLRWQSTTQAFIEPLGSGQALTMVRIPAGCFEMGSPDQEPGRDDDEGPVHEVEMQEFLMASTPITQAQWIAVMDWQPGPGETWHVPLREESGKSRNKKATPDAYESDTSLHPMVDISWVEAMEFCQRLSQFTRRHYTLPSEAQWEYACRAGSSSAYSFGHTLTAELVHPVLLNAGNADTEEYRSQSVRLYPANTWGLYDMHGSAWELCLDHWHENYEGAPSDGTSWIDTGAPDTADRVLRGGSFESSLADCRSASRRRLSIAKRDLWDVGLRVVCLPGTPAPELARPSLAQPDRDRSARQPQVLWIDDHPDNNRGERAALEAEGVTVLLASSPEEAIELLAASAPVDLLLSDLRQGDDPEAGLRLFPLLRAKGIVIPVIFYVGVLSDERTRQALEAGALAVINRRDQLLEAVQRQLASRATEKPA